MGTAPICRRQIHIAKQMRKQEFCKRNKRIRKEMKNMVEKIKKIVAESLGAEAETITEATSFKEDLGADSLDLFEMVMAFEEEFEVEIPSEDLEKIATVGDVVKYLENQK
jgi:acyl carrier protein